MKEINLTDLEKKVLLEIKDELDCGWEDESGNYTNCWNPFIENTKPEIKGALGSLVKKGVITICSCESKNDVICINDLNYLNLV